MQTSTSSLSRSMVAGSKESSGVAIHLRRLIEKKRTWGAPTVTHDGRALTLRVTHGAMKPRRWVCGLAIDRDPRQRRRLAVLVTRVDADISRDLPLRTTVPLVKGSSSKRSSKGSKDLSARTRFESQHKGKAVLVPSPDGSAEGSSPMSSKAQVVAAARTSRGAGEHMTWACFFIVFPSLVIDFGAGTCEPLPRQ
jgi:hypothetical protein